MIESNVRRTAHGAWRIWWRAIRPFAYPASAVPALLGVALSWSAGYPVKYGLALLTLLGVIAAHTGANLMSDYFDFKRGIDREGTLGGSGVMVEGLLSPKSIMVASLISFCIAGTAGLIIMMNAGTQILWLVAGGFVAGAFYSLPPIGFKYGALGELVVFLAFGVGITVGSYVVQVGAYSWTPVWYSLPFGLLVSAILHANNIRDRKSDLEVGVRTLAGIFGNSGTRLTYAAIVALAYLLVVFFVINGDVLPGAAACLITLPLAWKLIVKFWSAPRISRNEFFGTAERTAQLSLAFGVTMIVGIVAWTLSV